MVKNANKENREVVTKGFFKQGLGQLKTELNQAFDEQNERNLKVFATKQDLGDLEYRLKTELKADINKNQVYLEKIVAKLDKKEEKDLMHGYQHKIAEDRLANHDKRIEKLEKAVA